MISLRPGNELDINAWTYNGNSPGQTLRVKQGDNLSVNLHNELAEESTIHWHGIRTPNLMDGVPYITQPPVKSGSQHAYQFECADAGTYWYHPHFNSEGQIGRGLCGAIVVEEDKPIEVDRDLVWVLSDWRISRDMKLVEDFGQLHDRSHSGRLGNVSTVNGKIESKINVRPGERLRLRIINTATARIFSPAFENLSGWIVALDGHPVEPRPIGQEKSYIAPGNRTDLILDIPVEASPDDAFAINDHTYRGRAFTLVTLVISGKSIRRKLLAKPKKMAPNPIGAPDLSAAETKSVAFEGGAMGGMAEASLDGRQMSLREMAGRGFVWATNGKIYSSLEALRDADRLFNLKRGKSYIFKLQNRTAFPHPIHLHGHTFQVIARQGQKPPEPLWQDTVLIFPDETVEIAFLADNPGDWLLHCHVLGHAASGMIAAVNVD